MGRVVRPPRGKTDVIRQTALMRSSDILIVHPRSVQQLWVDKLLRELRKDVRRAPESSKEGEALFTLGALHALHELLLIDDSVFHRESAKLWPLVTTHAR